MQLIKVKDYHEMSELLTKYFIDQIVSKPDSVLSFTTGKTPQEFLMKLADAINYGLDISNCIFMNLDEFVGKKDAAYSVHRFMHTYLYDNIAVMPKEIHMINGEAEDKEEELKRYGNILKQHGRDIQILGLGINGHIGANEPGTPFNSRMFVADSLETTMRSTKDYYGLKEEEVPTQMYTMGFTEIMEADHVILAASGSSKAYAVKAVAEGEISEDMPASILRNHPNFTFIVDEAAGALLK